MERVLEWMEHWGYPRRGTNWLRRRRLPIVMVMAVLSWVVLIMVCVTFWFLGAELANLVLKPTAMSIESVASTRP